MEKDGLGGDGVGQAGLVLELSELQIQDERELLDSSEGNICEMIMPLAHHCM